MSIVFDLWGQHGYADTDIVGEASYATAIRALLGNDFKPQGTEIFGTAQLIPEPRNE